VSREEMYERIHQEDQEIWDLVTRAYSEKRSATERQRARDQLVARELLTANELGAMDRDTASGLALQRHRDKSS
jgi:hypothetical protein